MTKLRFLTFSFLTCCFCSYGQFHNVYSIDTQHSNLVVGGTYNQTKNIQERTVVNEFKETFIILREEQSNNLNDNALVKIDSNGVVIWSRKINANMVFRDLTLSHDGDQVYVLATEWDNSTFWYPSVMVFDSNSGNLVKSKQYKPAVTSNRIWSTKIIPIGTEGQTDGLKFLVGGTMELPPIGGAPQMCPYLMVIDSNLTEIRNRIYFDFDFTPVEPVIPIGSLADVVMIGSDRAVVSYQDNFNEFGYFKVNTTTLGIYSSFAANVNTIRYHWPYGYEDIGSLTYNHKNNELYGAATAFLGPGFIQDLGIAIHKMDTNLVTLDHNLYYDQFIQAGQFFLTCRPQYDQNGDRTIISLHQVNTGHDIWFTINSNTGAVLVGYSALNPNWNLGDHFGQVTTNSSYESNTYHPIHLISVPTIPGSQSSFKVAKLNNINFNMNDCEPDEFIVGKHLDDQIYRVSEYLISDTLELMEITPNHTFPPATGDIRNCDGTFVQGSYTPITTSPNEEAEDLDIYPNPLRDVVNIISNGELDYEIYNATGEKILIGTLHSGGNRVNLSSFPCGLYIIRAGKQVYKISKTD